jgi:uncharacterized membrane protein YbhN (UPF0104 family)
VSGPPAAGRSRGRRRLGLALLALAAAATLATAGALAAGWARPADARRAARAAGDSVQGFVDALRAMVDRLAEVDRTALAVGLLLTLANLALRSLAWRNIIAAAYPTARVPRGAVFGAYCAGVGVNAVLPARAGDAVKLFLIHGRVAGASYPTLASSLVAETLFDAVVGCGLLIWSWQLGVLPGLPSVPDLPAFEVAWYAEHPWVLLVLIAVLLGVLLWLQAHVRAFWARVRQGLVILSTPLRYLRSVASLQALGWCCRIGAAWAFLNAFHIDAGLREALLVQVASSVATLVPATPGGLGPRQALLVLLLGGAAPKGDLLAFSVGMELAVTALNVTVGVVCLAVLTRGLRFRDTLRRARTDRMGRTT